MVGVLPEHHRTGIGLTMVEAAESCLAGRDVGYLQGATWAFSFGCGFRPREEMPELSERNSHSS